MLRNLKGAGLFGVAFVVACGGNPAPPHDGGSDGMTHGDGGGSSMCPVSMIPNPSQQFGACCYRTSQEDHQDSPELRLRSLQIIGPEGSALALPTPTGQLLNSSLANETFNWLFRVTGADADGPVTIQTGYGTRDATAGTYTFSSMPRYAPITLEGTITGEMMTTDESPTGLIVPVFDPTGEVLQVELSLHAVQLVMSEFNDHRSCVGTIGARFIYTTGAQLTGFITVDEARAGMINVASIHAELCTLIASPNLGDPPSGAYCAQPQADWQVQPDGLCTGETCMRNAPGAEVCSEDGAGPLPACNAWLLVANFAAVGIDITD